MPTPIILPELGIDPVTLSIWYADVGDPILEGEKVVEVLGNGATFDVVAPASGTLAEKRAFVNEQLAPGQVLGIVE
jgi:pyruvate/2-oxoglutarate dehydrogenase complex dihydrolipoamide acyltransferase (E2) component